MVEQSPRGLWEGLRSEGRSFCTVQSKPWSVCNSKCTAKLGILHYIVTWPFLGMCVYKPQKALVVSRCAEWRLKGVQIIRRYP